MGNKLFKSGNVRVDVWFRDTRGMLIHSLKMGDPCPLKPDKTISPEICISCKKHPCEIAKILGSDGCYGGYI